MRLNYVSEYKYMFTFSDILVYILEAFCSNITANDSLVHQKFLHPFP